MKKNILFIAIFALAGLYSCSSQPGKDKKSEPEKEQAKTNQNSFFISEKQLKDSGMELAKIKTDTFHYEVSAQGYLDVPPSNKAIISSFMPGKAENVHLLSGDFVKKGELLLDISNPQFLLMQQNYLKSKEDLNYLKKEYERQKSLAADSISSQKKLQQSRNAYLNTLANYTTLRQQLMLLHFNIKEIEKGNFSALSPVYAPISGYITRLNITRGSHINPSDVIMEIIDDSHIHLELKVFEKDVLKLQKGQPIEFSIPDMGTEIFHGYVHLIGKKIDPESRTVLVHGHLSGNHPTFVTGMYVEAKILTGSFQGLAVPTTAIIKQEENYFILRLVKQDKNGYKFEKVQVIPGLVKGNKTQVKGNRTLKPGQVILGKGAFFLI